MPAIDEAACLSSFSQDRTRAQKGKQSIAPMSASAGRCPAIVTARRAVKVLKRINAEIEARRAAGEDLPPPPKTAIAGPEYFGLNQLEVIILI